MRALAAPESFDEFAEGAEMHLGQVFLGHLVAQELAFGPEAGVLEDLGVVLAADDPPAKLTAAGGS